MIQKNRILSIIFFSTLIFFGTFHTQKTAEADTYSVCASSCAFTTITSALEKATDDNTPTLDIIDVQAGYDETGESFPLTISKSITIDCSDVETIGNISNNDGISITDTNVTIQDCELDYINISVGTSDFTLNSNTVDTSAATTLSAFTDNADNITITNNTGLNGIQLYGAIDNANISDNTFEIRYTSVPEGILIEDAVSNTTVDGNTISNYNATRGGYGMITMSGADGNPTGTGNTITNNIIDFPVEPSDNGGSTLISTWSNTGLTISDNYLTMASGTTGSSNAIALVSQLGNTNATILNNTIKMNSTCGTDCRGIYIHDLTSSYTSTIDAQYNIFYLSAPLTGEERREGMTIFKESNLSTVTVTDNYNAYYNTSHAAEIGGTYANEISLTTTNSYTSNPALMTGDASSTNDMYPFPASCYLDVNSNQDIGAYGNSTGTDKTRSTIYVSPASTTINYTSVDFDNLEEALDAGCTATPNINVSAGSYPGPVSVTDKTGLTITGAGSGSTTVNATGQTYGFNLNNVDSTNISGFTISGDSSTTSALSLSNGSDSNVFTSLILSGVSASASGVISTRSPFTYSSNDYLFTGGTDGVFYVYGTGANDYADVTVDDADVSAFANTQDWNIALTTYSGSMYLTMFANAADFTTAAAFDSHMENTFMGGLGADTITVDCWDTAVLDYDSGSYTYNSPTGGTGDCSGSSPTVVSGFQTPPSIYFPQIKGALIFSSSNSNQISSSTIQNNAYGVLFTGSAASNTIGSSMTFSSNSTKDLYTSSTGDNIVTDCTGLSYTEDGDGVLTGCPGGALGVEIVDGAGDPVVSPSFGFPEKDFSWSYQTSEADLGTASQKIRVTNTTAAPAWSLSLAATDGSTAFWGGTTADYDYNDPTASAGDGSDTDSLGGQMSVDILWASVAPQSGCTTVGISKGSATSFNESTQNSITLINASALAMTNCYFDTMGVDLSQTIPEGQAADSYSLDMTLTVTAV